MGASASSGPTPRDGGAPWPEGRIAPPPGLAAEVLSLARGRGAYRALVAARWQEAERRGVPRLVTQAGALSPDRSPAWTQRCRCSGGRVAFRRNLALTRGDGSNAR